MLTIRNSWLSLLALIFGFIISLGGMSAAGRGDIENADNFLSTGPICFLGAIAYGSAKKRYLRKATDWPRLAMEAGCIGLILFIWLGQNNLQARIMDQPLGNLVAPLIALPVFAWMFNKARKSAAKTEQP